MRYAAILLVLMANSALADSLTIGPDGINSKATGLNGDGIEIGQIEPGRSGKPGYGAPMPEPSASNTKPTQVYFQTSVANSDEGLSEHATVVAGVMIGDDTGGAVFEGVAPMANLHSAAIGFGSDDELDVPSDADFGRTADTLSRISGPDPNDQNHIRRMRAINLSATRPLQAAPGDQTDGNSHLTLFVDWNAFERDVLWVVAWGNDNNAPQRAPTDNFNGMTIAASAPNNPTGDTLYRKFADINSEIGFPLDGRGPISLIAPGQNVDALGLDDDPVNVDGTSVATPHVTGTAALLQQHAKPKVVAGNDPKWNANSQRHEVMKAVMMNSADKLVGVHGSTRNVLNINGNNWLLSPAFGSDDIPLDQTIGTGHLNARRSLQQYESGEYNPGSVPSIGWDYPASATFKSTFLIPKSEVIISLPLWRGTEGYRRLVITRIRTEISFPTKLRRSD